MICPQAKCTEQVAYCSSTWVHTFSGACVIGRQFQLYDAFFTEIIPALSLARMHSTWVTLATLAVLFSFGRCRGISCVRALVFVLKESLLAILAMPYCLKITSKHKFNSLFYSALQIWQKYIIKINFTTDFVSAAAEIEQIVKLKINFTIDFGPTAAEIEQIVKLIEIIKRNN